MKEIKRYSPVEFKVTPLKTEIRDHWNVILEYHNEGDGPWLVDLSHRTRLDLQTGSLDTKNRSASPFPPPPASQCWKRVSDQPHEPNPEFHLPSGDGTH